MTKDIETPPMPRDGDKDLHGTARASQPIDTAEINALREKLHCICKAHDGYWMDIYCPYHGNRWRGKASAISTFTA